LRQINTQHGYTLVELLLYMAISAILLTTIVIFFGMMLDARIKNQSINEVNQQGEAAMEYIAQTVRNANSITLPVGAGSASSLTLAVPTGTLSPTVIDVANGALEVKEGAAAYVALTNNKVQVTNLTFINLTRSGTLGAVQISMTIKRVNTAGRNEYDYQKTFTTTAALR
jgi:prepilin-type N-terminal cleavage/methylation domain-containing protein